MTTWTNGTNSKLTQVKMVGQSMCGKRKVLGLSSRNGVILFHSHKAGDDLKKN